MRIESATLKLATQNICPFQFLTNRDAPVCNSGNFANSNITAYIKDVFVFYFVIIYEIKLKLNKFSNFRCDRKPSCVFSFDKLPKLLCIEKNQDQYTNDPYSYVDPSDQFEADIMPRDFQYVNVVYTCMTPRKRCISFFLLLFFLS